MHVLRTPLLHEDTGEEMGDAEVDLVAANP